MKNISNYLYTIIIFILMVILTVSSGYYFNSSENKKREIRNRVTANEISNIIKNLTSTILHPMRGLGDTISANINKDNYDITERFHRYIQSTDILNEHSNVIAWAYTPKIRSKNYSIELKDFENDPSRDKFNYKKVKIYPNNYANDYVAPVVIVEPLSARKQALGYNILSSETRRTAAERAMETGTIQISSRLDLEIDAPGVILFQPVYSSETVPDTYEERRKTHIGFILAAYTTGSLLEAVSDRFEMLNVDVDIHDYGLAGAEVRPSLSYSTLLSSSRIDHAHSHVDNHDDLLKLSDAWTDYIDIEVAGRVWRILVREHPGSFSRHNVLTIIIIVGGILLTILATLLMLQQQQAAMRLTKRVKYRTQALERARQELEKSRDHAERQALIDPLTGLGNRRYLFLKFDQAEVTARKEGVPIAVFLLDIDYFKTINDSIGHDFGDKILVDFANRVSEKLGEYVSIVRLGGDEFAFLMIGAKGKCNAAKVAATLLEIIRETGEANNLPTLTGSIGYAKMLSDDCDLSDVMKHADTALYEAKQNGRNGFVKYTKSLGAREDKKNAVLHAVRTDLQKDAFVPAFQPILKLDDSKLLGFEILARWKHETKGILAPAAFWEALEDDNLSTEITIMVIEKAFRQISEFIERGCTIEHIGINVTEQMLKDKHFPDTIIALAEKCNLRSNMLNIEITERILLSRKTDDIKNTLQRLANYGVTIAFDDFGTGFASLTHLRTFPINCVKVDRSFVQGIEHDVKSRAIIAAVSQMAHELGFTIIAEGIETAESVEILKKLRCDAGQGFLFGKPAELVDMTKFFDCTNKMAA